MIYNQVNNGQEVDQEQIVHAAEDPYYRYWLLSLYNDQPVIPEALKVKQANAISLHQYYIQNNYEVTPDGCDTLNSYPANEGGTSEMLMVKCKNKGTEDYYFGLIGPIDSSGFIDPHDTGSIYYSVGVLENEFDETVKKIVDYYNNQEE